MDIQFKKVELEDLELLRNLEEGAACYMFPLWKGEEGYKKYIQESEVFIIMSADKPIGTISYKNQADKTVFIDGLSIIPAYRDKGIATEAMNQLLNKVGNRNFAILVHPHNTPALLIYLRLGFCITKWKANYFGDGEPHLYLQKKAK